MQTFKPVLTGDCQPPEYDPAETITADIAARLIAGESIAGLNGHYRFVDAIQHLYGFMDECEAMDGLLLRIAQGDEQAAADLQAVLHRAAFSFSEKIESSVIAAIAEKRREEVAERQAEARIEYATRLL